MSEPESGDRGALLAVALVIGGMASIVLVGGTTFALMSPSFVATTLAGLSGEGPDRQGVLLFAVQIVVFVAVCVGLLVVVARKGRG